MEDGIKAGTDRWLGWAGLVRRYMDTWTVGEDLAENVSKTYTSVTTLWRRAVRVTTGDRRGTMVMGRTTGRAGGADAAAGARSSLSHRRRLASERLAAERRLLSERRLRLKSEGAMEITSSPSLGGVSRMAETRDTSAGMAIGADVACADPEAARFGAVGAARGREVVVGFGTSTRLW